MSGWFSSIIAGVSQSLGGLEDDLREFVTTITGDTEQAVTRTVATLRDKQEKGTTLASVSDVVEAVTASIQEVSDRGKSRPTQTPVSSSTAAKYKRRETPLQSIQHDRDTYTREPEDPAHFEQWSTSFDLSSQREAISNLLSTDEEIRKLHTELIPRTVSYNLFWRRYFYRLYRQQMSEKKRQALVERIQKRESADDLAFGDWDEDIDTSATSASTSAAKTPVQTEEDKLAHALDSLSAPVTRTSNVSSSPATVKPKAAVAKTSRAPKSSQDSASAPPPAAPTPVETAAALSADSQLLPPQQEQVTAKPVSTIADNHPASEPSSVTSTPAGPSGDDNLNDAEFEISEDISRALTSSDGNSPAVQSSPVPADTSSPSAAASPEPELGAAPAPMSMSAASSSSPASGALKLGQNAGSKEEARSAAQAAKDEERRKAEQAAEDLLLQMEAEALSSRKQPNTPSKASAIMTPPPLQSSLYTASSLNVEVTDDESAAWDQEASELDLDDDIGAETPTQAFDPEPVTDPESQATIGQRTDSIKSNLDSYEVVSQPEEEETDGAAEANAEETAASNDDDWGSWE